MTETQAHKDTKTQRQKSHKLDEYLFTIYMYLDTRN